MLAFPSDLWFASLLFELRISRGITGAPIARGFRHEKKNALGMTEPGNSIFDTKRFCLSSFYAVLDIWHVL